MVAVGAIERWPRAAVASSQGVGGVMLLAGPGTELKGKLTEKMRYRPTAMIKPLMPAGASSLERLYVVLYY